MRFLRGKSSEPAESSPAPNAPNPSRSSRTFSVRALLLLVITSGLVTWAAKVVYDVYSPVNQWARQARLGDVSQRRQAVGELATLSAVQSLRAVPPLVLALKDQDEQVATTAASNLLAGIRLAIKRNETETARSAILALVQAADDPRPNVRAAATSGLGLSSFGQIEPGAIQRVLEALANRLNDPIEEVRWRAAGSLFHIAESVESSPPPQLLAAITSDSSPRVRRAAAMALGSFPFRDDSTTLSLLQALKSDDSELRRAADSSLRRRNSRPGATAKAPPPGSQLVPPLVEALHHPDPLVRFHACRILRNIGPRAEPAIPSLIAELSSPFVFQETESLFNNPATYDPACEAALALSQLAPGSSQADSALKALIHVIETETNDSRQAAAASGLLGFPRAQASSATPALLEALRQHRSVSESSMPASEFCLAVAHAAPGSPSAPQAIEALYSTFAECPFGYTRTQAAAALASFGAEAAPLLPRLRALLSTNLTDPVRASLDSAIAQIEGKSPDSPR